ncbi:cytochrome P450 306a1-like [Zophobas morio]|uniref:cytochrome P450 306a1-like n=1 Tax=Zophobas morio TaxID=2755281 RepID=UPI003082F549
MIVTVCALVLLILLLKSFRAKKTLPGPWNLPILGYLHKLDPKSPHLSLTKLAQKYGPVYNIKLGSINAVVIADVKILKKVLAKDETLGRPSLFMIDTVFENKGLVFTSVDLWKDQRKFLANFLKTAGISKVSPNRKKWEMLVTNQVEKILQVMKSQTHGVPVNPSEFVTQYANSIAELLLVGKQSSQEDKTVTGGEKVASVTFRGPLNFMPFLRVLPYFKKTLSSAKQSVNKVRQNQRKLITDFEKSSKDGVPNLVETFQQQMSHPIYNFDQLQHLIYDLFMTFNEPIITSLLWILLFLAQYHEVQDKVRQELFEVSLGETVTMDDFANLHYTRATIAETARIRTLAPTGLPHSVSETICVEGFTIPKGAMILPLLWAIHMDPNLHEKPDEFRPGRFLDDEGKFFEPESFLPFQSGKRMCLGKEIAQTAMSLFVANVVKDFKIERPDSSVLDLTGVYGVVLVPKPQTLIFKKI